MLPPGDWNKQKLLAMADIMDMRKRREERRQAALIAAESQVNLSGMAQPASTPVIQPKVSGEKSHIYEGALLKKLLLSKTYLLERSSLLTKD